MSPGLVNILNLAKNDSSWEVIDSDYALKLILTSVSYNLHPIVLNPHYWEQDMVCLKHESCEMPLVLVEYFEESASVITIPFVYDSWFSDCMADFLSYSPSMINSMLKLGLSIKEHPFLPMAEVNTDYPNFKEFVSAEVGNRLNSHLWGVRSADIEYTWKEHDGTIVIPPDIMLGQWHKYGVNPSMIASYIVRLTTRYPDLITYRHETIIKGELSAVTYVMQNSERQYLVSCNTVDTPSNHNYYPYPIAFLDVIRRAVDLKLKHSSGFYFRFKHKCGAKPSYVRTVTADSIHYIYQYSDISSLGNDTTAKLLRKEWSDFKKSLPKKPQSITLSVDSVSGQGYLEAYADSTLIAIKPTEFCKII